MVRLVGFIIVSFFFLGYEMNLIFKIKKLDYSSVEKVKDELKQIMFENNSKFSLKNRRKKEVLVILH